MISKKILGVRIDFGLNMEKALDIIENKLLKDGENHIVCTTNPEFVVDAQEDSEFKKIINDSSLSVPDGVGVILFMASLSSYFAFNFTGCTTFTSPSGVIREIEKYTVPVVVLATTGLLMVVADLILSRIFL